MAEKYTVDGKRIESELNRFSAYVQYRNYEINGTYRDDISFTDLSVFPGREEDEGYKVIVAERAREKLRKDEWNESWIGTGEISKCVIKAMYSMQHNLMDPHQGTEFRNRCNPEHKNYKPESEAVLYDIFCGKDDRAAFKKAVATFGAKYDLIAFLFYMKDPEKYLPIRSNNFDESFKLLNIEYVTSHKCSWENYQGFLSIVEEIRNVMEKTLLMNEEPRLIDAHSFLWIIHEPDYKQWNASSEIEIEIENHMERSKHLSAQGLGKISEHTVKVINRSQEVVRIAKERAKGICQLCSSPAPFKDKKGVPYLEVHHVDWLSRGGIDSTDNAVALCPNCHTKMHIVDDSEDVEKLKKILKQLR